MKRSLMALAVGTSIIVAGLIGAVQAQKAKQVVYVSSAKAEYKTSPTAGVSMQVLAGDPDQGPHATFTKFNPGYDAGMHTHSNDVSLVVIKGAYLYKDDAGENVWGPANTCSSRRPQTLERRRQDGRRDVLSRRVGQVRPHSGEVAAG